VGLAHFNLSKSQYFFKLMCHRRLQQCAHLLDSSQPKRVHPNQISSKKLQLGPKNIFWAIWTPPAYWNSFGLNLATNGSNSFYDVYDLWQLACHIRCHIIFCPAWQNWKNKVMTYCINDFPRVIKLMVPQNKVSLLVMVCDAQLLTEHFCNNWRH
jgi:hypothetical protein